APSSRREGRGRREDPAQAGREGCRRPLRGSRGAHPRDSARPPDPRSSLSRLSGKLADVPESPRRRLEERAEHAATASMVAERIRMAKTVRAAVLLKPKTIEHREFPRPAIGSDDALLRIEACGICGSDYEQYEGAA